MRYSNLQASLLEIPGELSLVFSISGCHLRCEGCHTPELRNPKYGDELSLLEFKSILEKDLGLATCVLFMGGEWEKGIGTFLMLARTIGYKTALYTGAEAIEDELAEKLDYIKLGPYRKGLGGLESESTNQRLYKMPGWVDITSKFRRNDGIR